MEGELLRTFIAIHQTGSLTDASDVLHRSQSAVSRRIAQLEIDMGAPLFDRVPAGMRLNAAGRELLPFAEAAAAALKDGRSAVQALQHDDRGLIPVAVVGTLASTWLTAALRAFASQHAGVDVRLRTATSQEVIDLVRSGDASFGISYLHATDPMLASRKLFDERLVVACAIDHPRAGRRAIALAALRDEAWFVFPDRKPPSEASSRYIRGLLTAAGVPEASMQIVDSLTAHKRLIEAGFGIALVPASGIDEELRSGSLTTIPLSPTEPSQPVTLTTRKHAYLSHAARALLEALMDAGHDSQAHQPGATASGRRARA